MIDFDNKEIKKINMGYIEVPTEDISSDDMPNDLMKDIFDLCGRDTAIKLLVFFAGNTIAIPIRAWNTLQKNFILKNYDGKAATIKKIARKLCVTEKYIREILRQNHFKNVPVVGQLTILDALKTVGERNEQ